jgi:hypothetical protein
MHFHPFTKACLATTPFLLIAQSAFMSHEIVYQAQSVVQIMPTQSSAHSSIVTPSISLQAWQEDPNLPPVGVPVDPDRPIGFAQVNFMLENKTENLIEVDIDRIEVQEAIGHRTLMTLRGPKILLRGLEISPQQFRLTHSTGYGQIQNVEAVISYRIKDQSLIARSRPVTIR